MDEGTNQIRLATERERERERGKGKQCIVQSLPEWIGQANQHSWLSLKYTEVVRTDETERVTSRNTGVSIPDGKDPLAIG